MGPWFYVGKTIIYKVYVAYLGRHVHVLCRFLFCFLIILNFMLIIFNIYIKHFKSILYQNYKNCAISYCFCFKISTVWVFFSPTEDVCLIRRCITSGFFANAAYLHYTGVYRTVRDDHELHIHPTSVLTFTDPPKWYSLCFICMLIS